MARQLLADPDWPKKVRDGRADTVVPCVYNNVCKHLDERFHKVRCTLWRKDDLHAPRPPRRTEPPQWPADAHLRFSVRDGIVVLEWTPADGNVYGYLIERAEKDRFVHIDSARGVAHRFQDISALGGVEYRYRVIAYDLAGNRSRPLGPEAFAHG